MSSISPSIVPDDLVVLTVLQSNPSISINSYIFQAYYSNQWWDLDDPNGGTTSSLSYKMKVLGQILFRVKAIYQCNGNQVEVTSNTVFTRGEYCNNNFSAFYAADFNADWNSTLVSTSSGNGKYEYGFSVNYDSYNNLGYQKDTFSNFANCSEPINQSSTISHRSAGANPNHGGKWTVGKFHTHPPLTNCDPSISRSPGPSTIDLQGNLQFPCIVRDYRSSVQGGHAANLQTQDYSYHSTCTNY